MRRSFNKSDFIGKKYHDWTIIKFINSAKLWVKCKCGYKQHVRLPDLENGQTKSCWACYNRRRRIDLIGKKFHYFIVINSKYTKKYGNQWLCQCKCGNFKTVSTSSLINGDTKSCGCWRKERMQKFQFGKNNANYNFDLDNMSQTDLYKRRRRIAFWARKVKERDGFCCQKCGCRKYKNNLIAHHIKAYHKYPNYRRNLSNGITLCRTCHAIFHRIYGIKNFKPKDTAKFLASKNY